MGRWQVLQETPKVICDTGHNKEGLKYTMAQLKSETFKNLHIVLGVVSDKNLGAILPLFPKDARYYFCKPDVPRGMNAAQLASNASEFGLKGNDYPSVKAALKGAQDASAAEDIIYVGGSTFVVAEVV